MAIFNEILVGRFNRGLQKLFAIKAGPPVRQLAGEISVNHPLQSGSENRYLEGWKSFAYFDGIVATAGQNTSSRLRNPPTSNIIVVLERIIPTASAAADQFFLEHQASTADLSIIAHSTAERWDPRGNAASATVRSINSAGSPTVALFAKLFLALAPNFSADFIIDPVHEIPLLPGDAIQVRSNNVALPMNVSWFWRERFLEESERS